HNVNDTFDLSALLSGNGGGNGAFSVNDMMSVIDGLFDYNLNTSDHSIIAGIIGNPFSAIEGTDTVNFQGNFVLRTVVPAPGTLLLFGAGLFGLAVVVRRRRQV